MLAKKKAINDRSVKTTYPRRPPCDRSPCKRHKRSSGELLGEIVEQRKNFPLILTWVDRPRPILDLCGFPRPGQRKPCLSDFIKKVTRARRLHVHLEELFFKVLIRGREGFEQHAANLIDQRMPTDQFGRMGGIDAKNMKEKDVPQTSGTTCEKPAWTPTY